MLRRLLLAVAFAVSTARADAIPGQTASQLAAWGRSNAALRNFGPTIDDETGGTNYMANVRIDGHDAEFSAEPERDAVRMEYVAFRDVDDVAKHGSLLRDTVAAIYGYTYAADFRSANRIAHKGRTVAWQGKKMAYVAFGASFFFVSHAAFSNVLKNINACDALDCSDN